MLRRVIVYCLVLLIAGNASSQVSARNSQILLQPNASRSDFRAAIELQSHLAQITGKKPPLITNAKAWRNSAIVVGQGPLANSLAPGLDWSKLGSEQTKIVVKGRHMVVAGGKPRGTLYAVYRLLSQRAGVRWWTPWASRIPSNPKLTFNAMDWSESPAFESRDTFWFHAFDADWAVRNGSNGFSAKLDESRGGKLEYEGFVHTYYPLIPPDKYFATHPEWFSLINGKRTTDNAQLCTTNPELRKAIVEEVKTRLRYNPGARIVSVSQNDCFNPCQCPVCRAQANEQGSDSALVLDLANYVAEQIEPEFPNVAVDTLAYQWSRHPPRTMRPRHNVIVRLCSIECNFAYPLDAKENASFGDDIRGWSKLTNRLYVWNYCTDFANYLQPHPDYFTIGPTLQFFAANGVKGVFEQGAYQSTGGNMAELKAWATAQMLWNPKQDPNALIREFLNGYYGKAATKVMEYMKLLANEAKSWNLTFASPVSATFLRYGVMRDARKMLLDARKIVSSNPTLAWRIDQLMTSVDYVWLSRWSEFKSEAAKAGDAWPYANQSQLETRFLKLVADVPSFAKQWTPVTHVNEGGLSPVDFIRHLPPGP
jgi:hypothetical protein